MRLNQTTVMLKVVLVSFGCRPELHWSTSPSSPTSLNTSTPARAFSSTHPPSMTTPSTKPSGSRLWSPSTQASATSCARTTVWTRRLCVRTGGCWTQCLSRSLIFRWACMQLLLFFLLFWAVKQSTHYAGRALCRLTGWQLSCPLRASWMAWMSTCQVRPSVLIRITTVLTCTLCSWPDGDTDQPDLAQVNNSYWAK